MPLQCSTEICMTVSLELENIWYISHVVALFQIQKNWRGYYARKSVFNYRTYKEYLAGVMATNEIIRARIKKEKERADQERATRDDLIQEVVPVCDDNID